MIPTSAIVIQFHSYFELLENYETGYWGFIERWKFGRTEHRQYEVALKAFNLKSVMLAGVLGAIIQTPVLAQEQTVELLSYDVNWKYDLSGANNDTWRELNFDDSGWSSGSGIFAYPPTEPLPSVDATNQTTLSLSNGVGSHIVTYYFRRHFVLDSPSAVTQLSFSNLIDDGAVFYLNGQEIHRYNMPVWTNPGTFSWSTVEVFSTGIYGFSVIPTNLVEGENLLAVEVHQSTSFGSDVVFGLNLNATVISSPVIISHPADQTLETGKPLHLFAEVLGERLSYEWQKDDGTGRFISIHNATSDDYQVNVTQTADAGDYRVVAMNPSGSVTSLIASVEIVPDKTSPSIVSATVHEDPTLNQVTVRFSESIEIFTGRVAANYRIQEVGSSILLALNVQGFPQGPLVQLIVPNLNPAANYILTVNNVKDRNGNVITPDSQVRLLFPTSLFLFGLDHIWRWNEDDLPLPPAWRTNYLEPYLYGESHAVLYFDNSLTQELCAGTKLTRISTGPTTYYFSTQFQIPPAASAGKLQCKAVMDDGAVWFLNGSEIARWNMPPGKINHHTLATTNVTTSDCTPFTIEVTNLANGINRLSIELHQASDSATNQVFVDAFFGLELTAILYDPSAFPDQRPPVLNWRQESQHLFLSWDEAGCGLETSESILGPWTRIQSTLSNSYTTPILETNDRFWRLLRLPE